MLYVEFFTVYNYLVIYLIIQHFTCITYCCDCCLLAVYGADDLTQTNTVYLDSSFGMGYNLRELAQVRRRGSSSHHFLTSIMHAERMHVTACQ